MVSSISKYALVLLSLRNWRVHSELDGHLVVVREDHHGLLITNDKIEECCDQLPGLELVSTEIDGDCVQVRQEASESVV